jgi:erythromycin esterase
MTPQQPESDVLDSLRDHCVPLETTDLDADAAPLCDFADALDDVDVLGLGEATHRTREFAQFKHRLLHHLVADRGLRVIALEAPFSETLALRESVRDGTGSLRERVTDLGLSMYETEEVLACVEWLRAFNDGRPPSECVDVYGVDVQSAAGAASALRDWLTALRARDVAPTPAILDDDLLAALDDAADGVFEGEDVDEDRLRTAECAADALAEWFDSDPSVADAALTRRHLRVLRQACEFARTGLDAGRTEQWGLRDRFMAENVAWIREYTGADSVPVWAHNNHVKTGTLGGDGHPSPTMGDHLADRYGDGYYALGFQFARGTVRAYSPTDVDSDGHAGVVEWDGRTYARTDVRVPEPDADSVPGLFARVDAPALLLDYRSLPDDSPLSSWLADERPHRFVAGVVHPAEDGAFARSHRSLAVFDGAFFAEAATPTTPL